MTVMFVQGLSLTCQNLVSWAKISGSSREISIVVSGYFDFRVPQGFVFFRMLGVNIGSTLSIEPDIHGAVIDDFDVIKIKIRMLSQVLLDNLRQIFLIELEFPFCKPFLVCSI